MRYESSVTSISWIPSEAMTGPMRVPMDLGIGHYDEPPPDRVELDDLESLCAADRFRFANHLAVFVEVEDGRIVDAGYTGGGLVGSTTAKMGLAVTLPGISFPVLQDEPSIEEGEVRFQQTAGGRSGAPLPRRIDRPPYLRITAPSAWTTLALSITAVGDVEYKLVGASPFPRHWIYGPDGELAVKSGAIDFAEWTRIHDHDRSPWHDFEREILTAEAETQVERALSRQVMASKPDLIDVAEGEVLISQGQPGSHIYLILDGLLDVEVDGEIVAELGPGAIVGERAILESGTATATVAATTPVRAARSAAAEVDVSALEKVSRGHRRESTTS